MLVPGSRLNLGAHEAAVPVLLVQQGGRETGRALCGWGAAWDLILPKGWAMAFWIPLVCDGISRKARLLLSARTCNLKTSFTFTIVIRVILETNFSITCVLSF